MFGDLDTAPPNPQTRLGVQHGCEHDPIRRSAGRDAPHARRTESVRSPSATPTLHGRAIDLQAIALRVVGLQVVRRRLTINRELRTRAEENDEMTVDGTPASADTAIRPFEVHVSDGQIDDLERRVAAWRPPEREPVDDQSQGVQLETVQRLAEYWGAQYD